MDNKINKNKISKLELLAPAGNLEKMKTAIAFGADAVYLGIPDFSLRVRINDFTLAQIKQAVKYAHDLKKKVYVTTNIFAHNKHLDKLPSYIKKLKEYKVDAFIASDPGIIASIKKVWPKAEIHLSTQANCTNWQSAKFWFDQGVKRIVLGREVTLDEIKEIHKKVPKVELEYFIHGAMCMSYSGRCFLSKYFVNRSANLGDCVQPCRWKYEVKSRKLKVESEEFYISESKRPNVEMEIVEEEHGSYILNSRDLNLIKHLDELIDAGVVSFKIEGRAKSIYYIAEVVWAYRAAISASQKLKVESRKLKNELDSLYNELETKLFHRGYTEGFLFGNGGFEQNLENSHFTPEWEFCGEVLAGKQENKKVKKQEKQSPLERPACPVGRGARRAGCVSTVKVHNSLKVGDRLEILRPNCDIIKMTVEKLIDAKNNEEITEAHGGADTVVILETKEELPLFSVIRRRLRITN